MSSMSQFFGGSSGGILTARYFLASGTFTAPYTGNYLVTAIGGGGSGGKGAYGGTGGGAGGFCQKVVSLTAADTLTITVGAGGTAPGTNNTAGNAGGNTTVTATGVSMTANGGGAGNFLKSNLNGYFYGNA